MKLWQRAPFALQCGNCGVLVKQGDPLLMIEIAGVTRQRRRCQDCAGEPVNWDQIVTEAPPAAIDPPTFRPVAELAERFDARMAAAEGRDRE